MDNGSLIEQIRWLTTREQRSKKRKAGNKVFLANVGKE